MVSKALITKLRNVRKKLILITDKSVHFRFKSNNNICEIIYMSIQKIISSMAHQSQHEFES